MLSSGRDSRLLSGVLGSFRRNHVVRLTNQVLQFEIANRIQTLEQDPLVAADVGSGTNVFPLDQLRKDFRAALEAKAEMVQPERDKDLAGNFEAEFISPLQLFGRIGERQTVRTDGVDVHERAASRIISPQRHRGTEERGFTTQPIRIEYAVHKLHRRILSDREESRLWALAD